MAFSAPNSSSSSAAAVDSTSGCVSTARMSTLVETVSINYEDFSESFLTCSTCLCPFDGAEHNPKLLACSHTVCRDCLERISGLPQCRDTGSFRCPICRESIPVPRGGVSALPPSFLVNQLMDLMQRQRRDVIPKCQKHPAEELLFCETCDLVFCAQCGEKLHTLGACDHTVVPFSIAIKRMSEILLYKANQCLRNLNRAEECVQVEIVQLDENVDRVLDEVNQSFQELQHWLDRRRKDIVENVRQIRDDKRRILQDQLGIITTERAKVEQECQGLEYQLEVRDITRKIGDLNAKLDTSKSVLEPRENAFLSYDYHHSNAMGQIRAALNQFGHVTVSKTFPPLCEAMVLSATTHLDCAIRVRTVDYFGNPRKSGGDPVEARISYKGDPLETTLEDCQTGEYLVHYCPPDAGNFLLEVTIFGRPIKNSPLNFSVSGSHNPIWRIGDPQLDLRQPVRVEIGPPDDGRIYVLDTGNNRLLMLTGDGTVLRQIKDTDGKSGLAAQSCTGLALGAASFYTVNWRLKSVTEWSPTGQRLREISTREFEEPIDLCVDERRQRLYVADTGAGRVFMFDLGAGQLLRSFAAPTKKLPPAAAPEPLTALTLGLNGELLVACGPTVKIFDGATGRYLRDLWSFAPPKAPQGAHGAQGPLGSNGAQGSLGSTSGAHNGASAPHGAAQAPPLIGGLACDVLGTVAFTVTEKTKTFAQLMSYKGELLFLVDSSESRLLRPAGCAFSVGESALYVADLGNNCVKKYRYK